MQRTSDTEAQSVNGRRANPRMAVHCTPHCGPPAAAAAAAAGVAINRSSAAADAPGHPPDNPRCTPTPERDILAPNAGLRIPAACQNTFRRNAPSPPRSRRKTDGPRTPETEVVVAEPLDYTRRPRPP